MSLLKLELDQGARRFINHNPDKIYASQNMKYEHPIFEQSGKNCRYFPKKEIRKARLYILPKNLAEAHHLYHKHSLHP